MTDIPGMAAYDLMAAAFAISSGGHSGVFPEGPGEVVIGFESRQAGNICDTLVRRYTQ